MGRGSGLGSLACCRVRYRSPWLSLRLVARLTGSSILRDSEPALSKSRLDLDCVSAIDSNGRTAPKRFLMTHAEKTTGDQKCPYCGTQFTLNSPNQKFCSYQCRWDNRAELRTLKRRSASEGRRCSSRGKQPSSRLSMKLDPLVCRFESLTNPSQPNRYGVDSPVSSETRSVRHSRARARGLQHAIAHD